MTHTQAGNRTYHFLVRSLDSCFKNRKTKTLTDVEFQENRGSKKLSKLLFRKVEFLAHANAASSEVGGYFHVGKSSKAGIQTAG